MPVIRIQVKESIEKPSSSFQVELQQSFHPKSVELPCKSPLNTPKAAPNSVMKLSPSDHPSRAKALGDCSRQRRSKCHSLGYHVSC
ncbi:hypothetical protein Syun_016641 [Stephania yunnanensis]|uniref:Uncharacterized protein n=1 Tax=Stephania yunnanensis TaxID=152371 RepID=A0AAP0J5G4_9MAGN